MTNDVREFYSSVQDVVHRIGVAGTAQWARAELDRVLSKFSFLNESQFPECEHGIIEGGWCPECREEYRKAEIEALTQGG